MKKSILFFLITLLYIGGLCQCPLYDGNWETQDPVHSDEFNGTTLNDKWVNLGSIVSPRWFQGIEILKTSHAIVGVKSGEALTQDSFLTLLTKKVHYNYYTGGIKSLVWEGGGYHAFKYGYFEIRAKIPKGKGFWTTFWLHAGVDTSELPNYWYDEIDILEPSGCASESGYYNVVGWFNERFDPPFYNKDGEFVYASSEDLSLGYHKYAVEWLPERIIFYFDDQPFYSTFNNSAVPNHPMHLYIDQQIGPQTNAFYGGVYGSIFTDSICTPDIQTDNSLPQAFSIDYFRYYKLKMADITQTPTYVGVNFSTLSYSLKKSITMHDCTVLTSDPPIVLRATDFVNITDDFSVPFGKTFSVVPTPSIIY